MQKVTVSVRFPLQPGQVQSHLVMKTFDGPIAKLRAATMAFNGLAQGATVMYQEHGTPGTLIKSPI